MMLTARPTMTRLQTVSSTMTYSSWARLKPTSWIRENGEKRGARRGGEEGEERGEER